MNRRSFLAAAAAGALAAPAYAAKARTLVCVPQSALSAIDPVWSSAQIVRDMGFMVFDQLYGRDENNIPRPQMIEAGGHENGATRWTLRLRDGLRWHDGERVLSRDCAASVRRWMRRAEIGATLAERLDAIETPDDRTLVFRLNKPFAYLPTVLSRFIVPPMMMPERLANVDPFQPIPEAIGSGPFKWLADEHVPGSFAAFARNDAYVPRDEKPGYMAGGHRVLLDRVEWKTIPDGATASAALATGEIDWIEIVLPDLLPMLRNTPGVRVEALDRFGQLHFLRPNHKVGPTANPAIRQAMLAAMDQREIMEAVMGADPANMILDVGFLRTGDKTIDDAGMERLRGRRPPAETKAMLDKAGYDGTPLVLLHPTDHTFYHPSSAVTAQLLREAGFVVDDQQMDWATVQTRRASRSPLDKGGWSLFNSVVTMTDHDSPLQANFMRANGGKAWYGWPVDAQTETIFDDWLAATDPAAQTRLARALQLRAFEVLPFIPLGGFRQTAAWRDSLRGVLPGPSIVFWNVEKT